MIRCNSFIRSALFAAAAAAGWPAWALLTAPIAGVRQALALYLVGVTALYVAGLRDGAADARGRWRRGAIALGVALGCGVLGLFTRGTAELAVALAAVLAVARSAFFYRAVPARAVAAELILVLGGLSFARFLAGPSLLSAALSIWGFFLVQSLFFLFADRRARAPERHVDPFEEAHRRALALLE